MTMSAAICCARRWPAFVLLALLLALWAAVRLWRWDQESLTPLAEPALLEEYLGCDGVAPMLRLALRPWRSRARNLRRPLRVNSSNVRAARQRLRLPRVQIVDSKLYITCGDERSSTCLTHEARTLALLLKLTRLPDVDFLYDDGERTCHGTLGGRAAMADRTDGDPGRRAGPVPVVATETQDGCDNLLAPPRAFAALPDNARWLARAASKVPWDRRRHLALFRGTACKHCGPALDADGRPASARAKAVAFSVRHPELLDARFAERRGRLGRIDAARARALNWTGTFLTWEDALQYRAQLLLDGNTLPDRLGFVLSSMTAVLKQESPYRESTHLAMKPYVHYVPVRHDLSDLGAQLRWALRNSSRLRAIARNGAALALRLLSRRAQLCHWAGLLRELGRRTVAPVELDPAARPRGTASLVLHEPLVRPNFLRPQLTHGAGWRASLGELAGAARQLHLGPCVGLTSAHLCLDL